MNKLPYRPLRRSVHGLIARGNDTKRSRRKWSRDTAHCPYIERWSAGNIDHRASGYRTVGLPSSQTDDEGGVIGQGHLLDDGRPARVGRPRHPEEEEDQAKEAFN